MPDVYTWIALAVAATAFVLGIQVLGVTAGFALIVVVVGSLTAAAALAGNRTRRRLARREARFQGTDEVFRDPSTGVVTRVHVDPNTGERRYWEER
jgi:Flp pilus assembly protein TadB